MSLAIDVDTVEMVLLADGWHEVAEASFDIDAYEYRHDRHTLVSGGAAGARWKEPSGAVVVCPLTAVLAVKWNAGTPKK
jgi:hypothetical protein